MKGTTIRVLALMEASTVTGPAKNLITFALRARHAGEGMPPVELAIATFVRTLEAGNAFISAASDAGIRVHTLLERRRFDTQPMGQLRELIAKFQPDILQSHNSKSHLFIRWMGVHKRIPWIAFNHGYTQSDLKDRLYNQFDRLSLRAAWRVVAVCKPFGARLQQFGVAAESIRIQHNSVKEFQTPSSDAVEKLRADLQIGNRKVILAIGRLSTEKGHADLLRSGALLAERGALSDCVMVLVGDGPEREPLARLCRELNIGNAVIFAGQQRDVRPFYTMATMLALPSHSEGSPNVVLEAMAAGVAITATSVGGVPEILTHEQTGLLVPSSDWPAMAAALERLKSDDALRSRLIETARETVHAKYTPDVYRRSIVALYQEAMKSCGSAAECDGEL